MSKLACKCGNLISDSQYPSPTEGIFIGQVDSERSQNEMLSKLGNYFLAKKNNCDREWLKEFFAPIYPEDLLIEEIIIDITDKVLSKYIRSTAECSKCGRLWVQTESGLNSYESYSADSKLYNGILDTTSP